MTEYISIFYAYLSRLGHQGWVLRLKICRKTTVFLSWFDIFMPRISPLVSSRFILVIRSCMRGAYVLSLSHPTLAFPELGGWYSVSELCFQ